MRIAALGDAHLGRSYPAPLNEERLNTREVDFEYSFVRAIDLALAQEPDLIIWLGDIFDHPRPSYRSFRVAQAALRKVREQGARLVAISGNHDTPRLAGTGSPYSALGDVFSEFHFVHRFRYERFEVGEVVVHAVPHMFSVDETLDALAEAARSRSVDRTNLLITHPRVKELQPKASDLNEVEVSASDLVSDLVLLGHYHFFTRVREGMWYAGATDTFSFADDPDKPKGIVVLDTTTGECRHIPLEGQRPLRTVGPLWVRNFSPNEITESVATALAGLPDGAVVRVYLEDVDPEAWRLVDLASIRAAGSHLLNVRFEPGFVEARSQAELVGIESLAERWERFLERSDLSGYDRDRLADLGRRYLNAAVEWAT